jgi:hypothetical protein
VLNQTIAETTRETFGIVSTAVKKATKDCYSCKHRGNVPGDAHSSCNALNESDPLILAVYVQKNGPSFENLQLNPHGVRNGWCFWPINFDPCWVDKCNFYKAK